MMARKRYSVLVGRGLEPRHITGSILLHLLILFGIALLPAARALQDDAMQVELVLEDGSAGTKGGAAGGGGDPQAEESVQIPPAEETKPQVQEAPPPPPPPAETAENPIEPRPQVEPEQQREPQPKPPQLPQPKAAQPAKQAAASPVRQPGTAASGSATAGPGGAAGSGQGNEGQGAGVAGHGQGPGDEYFEKLRRHLARFKYFPEEASKKKQEGTVGVEFTIARDGTVLAAKVDGSSGVDVLDTAALDMLHKASPVPPLPDYVSGDRITISVPVEFTLGFFSRF